MVDVLVGVVGIVVELGVVTVVSFKGGMVGGGIVVLVELGVVGMDVGGVVTTGVPSPPFVPVPLGVVKMTVVVVVGVEGCVAIVESPVPPPPPFVPFLVVKKVELVLEEA